MNNLMVHTSSKSYPIVFTTDFSQLSEAILQKEKDYSKVIVISDSNVLPLYKASIKEGLKPLNKPIYFLQFDAGEHNKHLKTISQFYDELLKVSADRKSLIVALGGGVTGDMAGFCAATYMRGIDFIQVPTSLLAQVDSSVGGKTGVDFNGYKNLIGAFYQPELVYINVNTLKTLPKRELKAGMGEVIKHGFIQDQQYVQFLEQHRDEIMSLDPMTIMKMIRRSCEIKKGIVDLDEKESGIRALLNFGHTFGHSIERLKNFEILHGECVAIGMHGALKLSQKLGYIDDLKVKQGIDLIKAYQLPISVSNIEPNLVYDDMFLDKKTSHQRLVFGLLKDIGSGFLSTDVIDKQVIFDCLEDIC